MADSCISLASSTACPAFSSASVATSGFVADLFPFLDNVSNVRTFDARLKQYSRVAYVQSKYQDLFGCSNVNRVDPSDLYARYTISFICNAIVQNSIRPCKTPPSAAPPLCADSCAEFVLSEQRIVSTPGLCTSPSKDALTQLRADFTNCALPANSLSRSCVTGSQNEPDNCGFESNLRGLCSYCRRGVVNSTDSCCVSSNVESRCKHIHLPTFQSLRPLFTKTVTTTALSPSTNPTGSTTPGGNNNAPAGSLSGGQIAGIVVGSVVGALVLLGLLIFFCVAMRRRQEQNRSSSLNRPTPPRSSLGVSGSKPPPQFEALPGTRVTRMTALEAFPGSPNNGTSSGFDTSPESQGGVGPSATGPIPEGKATDVLEDSSPESAEYSSPDNGAGQSERMSSFKDYYSADQIHIGDLVSTLWAYQPRAPDEFELERGDMLKVVGIWDDGWATGVRTSMRAGDWSPSQRSGRDSVVSSNSARAESSADSDIKAFPLVCVCLPQHWRTTIEGEPSSPPPSE